MKTLLLLHVMSTFFLTGLIWVIQSLHYPGFQFVDAEQFREFHAFHGRNITFIVAPMMCFELLLGLYLCSQFSFAWPWSLLTLALVLIWASTFFLSVPLHSQLEQVGKDPLLIEKLVQTNWPRTILWTLRSLGLSYLLVNY